MTFQLAIQIPTITPSLNRMLRMHHRVLHRLQTQMAWEVKLAAGQNIPPTPLHHARITIVRRTTGIQPDTENLVGSVKQLVDVLLTPCFLPSRNGRSPGKWRHQLGLGFVQDDAPDILHLIVRAERIARKADQCTTITIEEL